MFFSYSDVTMTPGFDQKVQKSFAAHHYPHLTLSLPDRTMDQSFLDYLNLLRAQRVTLDDAGKSGIVKVTRVWFGMVSAAGGTTGFEE